MQEGDGNTDDENLISLSADSENYDTTDDEAPLLPSAAGIQINHTLSLDREHSHSSHTSGSRSSSEADSDFRSSLTESQEFIRPQSIWMVPRENKLILVSLALNDFAAQMSVGVMAPFFPDEAARKGVSDTISGWIFGVFALVQFLTSPIVGKMITRTGTKFLYFSGQFMAAGCTILFGLLTYVKSDSDDYTIFLVLCFTLRIFNALGVTAALTASFSITVEFFPDNVGHAFGLLELASGFGLMVGRGLGGPLYQLNGFMLPFIGVGSIMMALIPLHLCLLPTTHEIVPHRTATRDPLTIMQLLKVPSVLIVCLAIVYGALAWGILDPTLEPHLVVFNLSPTVLGLIFMIVSAFYALFAPLAGWAADNIYDSAPLLIIGFLGTAVGMLLLGPSPLFGLAPDYNELWLNLVALTVVGISVCLATVPTFDKIIDVADKTGMEDTLETYGLVAGLWGSCFALGEFIGPTIGGWLLDFVGFPWCTTITAFGSAFTGFLVFCLWLYERKLKKLHLYCSHKCSSDDGDEDFESDFADHEYEYQHTDSLINASRVDGLHIQAQHSHEEMENSRSMEFSKSLEIPSREGARTPLFRAGPFWGRRASEPARYSPYNPEDIGPC